MRKFDPSKQLVPKTIEDVIESILLAPDDMFGGEPEAAADGKEEADGETLENDGVLKSLDQSVPTGQ